MKRCSQCEFVYEDEQGVCDMDGSELVYEPTLYPPASKGTTTSPLRFRSRSFILTAAATLVMGSFLAVGFYGVTNRSAQPTSAVTPTTSESVPAPVVVQAEVAATPEKESSEAGDANLATDAKPRNASSTSASAKPASSGSRTTAKSEVKKPVPAQPKKEEDSKVGGLLKKTGRILKKPFKF